MSGFHDIPPPPGRWKIRLSINNMDNSGYNEQSLGYQIVINVFVHVMLITYCVFMIPCVPYDSLLSLRAGSMAGPSHFTVTTVGCILSGQWPWMVTEFVWGSSYDHQSNSLDGDWVNTPSLRPRQWGATAIEANIMDDNKWINLWLIIYVWTYVYIVYMKNSYQGRIYEREISCDHQGLKRNFVATSVLEWSSTPEG